GVRMLQNIAETTKYGTLGAFKELIPIGLCFVQLWSAGLYLQGIIEGLLGLRPLAHQHRLSIQPQLPSDWSHIRLNQLMVGSHKVSLEVAQDRLSITHHEGAEALEVHYRMPSSELQLHPDSAQYMESRIVHDETDTWLVVSIPVGQHCEIYLTITHITLQSTDNAKEANAANPCS
ncbi:MAG: glycosyl hydrolase family 65 protein, partial [Chloroflexota bacterium]